MEVKRKLFVFNESLPEKQKIFEKEKISQRSSKEEKLYFAHGSDVKTKNILDLVKKKKVQQIILKGHRLELGNELVISLNKSSPDKLFVLESPFEIMCKEKTKQAANS